jgi:hypothetical protein
MDRRATKVGIALGAVVLIAAVAYPMYFNWWDHHSCAQSGGSWNESRDECVEPDNADIPNTRESAMDRGN